MKAQVTEMESQWAARAGITGGNVGASAGAKADAGANTGAGAGAGAGAGMGAGDGNDVPGEPGQFKPPHAQLCFYHMLGRCSFGRNCWHAHGMPPARHDAK